MNRLLQKFSFKESRYERPSQKWVCGWRAEGAECPLGPNAQGQCCSTFECRPLRQGDRWQCTRPASTGARCQDGPRPDGTCCRPIPPCRPVRSLRAQRGLVNWLTVAFTMSLLLFLLGGSGIWNFVSPGPLTSHHALSAVACADCHVSAEAGLGQRLAGITLQSHHNQDSVLCLNCHDLGPNQFRSHGMATAVETALTRKILARSPPARHGSAAVAASLMGAPSWGGTDLACALCHQEHRGKDFSLTHLDDAQCQTCHAQQFTSFATDHPRFAGYPFTRRTRTIFDHVSHFGKHFQDGPVKGKAPDSCIQCHEPDPAGRTMLVKSFSQTCANCHAGQIEGEGRADAPGIPVLRIPGLDTRTLSKQGLWMGDWPEDAEGRLTPFMRLLMADDPRIDDAFNKLSKLDLLDLRKASPEELKAAEEFGWAVKQLFFDLATKGQAALRERLQKISKQELAGPDLTRLAGLLSMDTVTGAVRDWFPNLLAEIPLHQSGGKPADGAAKPAANPDPDAKSAVGPAAKIVAADAWVARGGWYRSRTDFAILYRPNGHADSFLHGWLDLTAPARPADPTPMTALFKTLTAPKAPGLCMKCHSIDARDDGSLLINWRTAHPVPNEHLFTKFAHAKHFSILDRKGCVTCHSFDSKSEYAKGFEGNLQPAVFSSNFRGIDKNTCADCHTAKGAGDSCLQCHNYHLGTFAPQLSKSAATRKLTAKGDAGKSR